MTPGIEMNIDDIEDHDLRQLWRMRVALTECGPEMLDRLITDLEVLLGALRSPDPTWSTQFERDVWALEQLHAVALDRQEAADGEAVASLCYRLRSRVDDEIRRRDRERT